MYSFRYVTILWKLGNSVEFYNVYIFIKYYGKIKYELGGSRSMQKLTYRLLIKINWLV